LLVSHAVESLAPLADQALFLDNSRVVWQGIGPELLESPHMIHLMTEPSKVNEEGHLGILLNSCIRRGWMQSRHKTSNQLIIEEQQEKGDVNINHWQSLRMCVTYRFPSGHNKNNCNSPKGPAPINCHRHNADKDWAVVTPGVFSPEKSRLTIHSASSPISSEQ